MTEETEVVDIYIDPEEDEIFFGPVTDQELKVASKYRNRKTVFLRRPEEEDVNTNDKIQGPKTPEINITETKEESKRQVHKLTPYSRPSASKLSLSEVSYCSIAEETGSPGEGDEHVKEINAMTPQRKKIAGKFKSKSFGSFRMSGLTTIQDISDISIEVDENGSSNPTKDDMTEQLTNIEEKINNLTLTALPTVTIEDEPEPSTEEDLYLEHNYFTPIKTIIDKNILKTPKSIVKADADGGFLKVLSEIALVKAEEENVAPKIKITQATPNKLSLTPSPVKIQPEIRKFRLIYKTPEKMEGLENIATPPAEPMEDFKIEDGPIVIQDLKLDEDQMSLKSAMSSIGTEDLESSYESCEEIKRNNPNILDKEIPEPCFEETDDTEIFHDVSMIDEIHEWKFDPTEGAFLREVSKMSFMSDMDCQITRESFINDSAFEDSFLNPEIAKTRTPLDVRKSKGSESFVDGFEKGQKKEIDENPKGSGSKVQNMQGDLKIEAFVDEEKKENTMTVNDNIEVRKTTPRTLKFGSVQENLKLEEKQKSSGKSVSEKKGALIINPDRKFEIKSVGKIPLCSRNILADRNTENTTPKANFKVPVVSKIPKVGSTNKIPLAKSTPKSLIPVKPCGVASSTPLAQKSLQFVKEKPSESKLPRFTPTTKTTSAYRN